MNINISLSRKVLKKIIKYLILFILGCITIFYANTLNVKAASAASGDVFNNILKLDMPPALYYYNINNGVASSVSTDYMYTSINPSDNSQDVYYYYNTSNISLSSTGYGMGFWMQFPFYFDPNTIYSVQLYFGTDSNVYFIKPPLRNVDLASSNTSYNNSKQTIFYHPDNTYFYTSAYGYNGSLAKYISTLDFSFTNPEGGSNRVFIPLTTSANYTGKVYFYGYKLYINGSLIDPSTLASKDDLQSATDSIIQEEQQTQDAIDKQTEQDKQQHEETMDTITGTDTSGADEEAGGFFNDFESNDFGLSDIITLPLTTIQSITSKSCTPLSLTLPFVNKTFELPCMTTIYSKFEPFYSIYQTITFGVISYWICVQIYAMVKGFKDPTKDEIEVMDL